MDLERKISTGNNHWRGKPADRQVIRQQIRRATCSSQNRPPARPPSPLRVVKMPAGGKQYWYKVTVRQTPRVDMGYVHNKGKAVVHEKTKCVLLCWRIIAIWATLHF